MTIHEIIDSLEDQAEDKDWPAGGDPDSIFTHDADALMEAARLLRKFDISAAVGESSQNLMQKYERHCMFRANRLDGGGEVYGSLVDEGSASMMFPSITVWHIVSMGYWNGVLLRSDDLVGPETAAIHLGRDDKYKHGIEDDKHCRECICPSCDLFQTDECLEGKFGCAKCDNTCHVKGCWWHPNERDEVTE